MIGSVCPIIVNTSNGVYKPMLIATLPHHSLKYTVYYYIMSMNLSSRTRSISFGRDNIVEMKEQDPPVENILKNLTLGARASPTLLDSKATPGSRLSKRVLKISPNKPRGGPRKLSVCEGASPPLREYEGRARSYSLNFIYDEESAAVERKVRRPATGGSDKLSAGIRGVRRPAVGGFELDFNSNKETNDVCQPGTSAIKGTKRSRASRIRGRRIAAKSEA